MGDVRACAYVLVILLSFQLIAGKPLFGLLTWCYLMCDDDDDRRSSTTPIYYDDDYDYDLCDCGPRRRATPRGQGGPVNMVIPPANGMNLTMLNRGRGRGWQMNVLPWTPPSTPVPGTATTAAGK